MERITNQDYDRLYHLLSSTAVCSFLIVRVKAHEEYSDPMKTTPRPLASQGMSDVPCHDQLLSTQRSQKQPPICRHGPARTTIRVILPHRHIATSRQRDKREIPAGGNITRHSSNFPAARACNSAVLNIRPTNAKSAPYPRTG